MLEIKLLNDVFKSEKEVTTNSIINYLEKNEDLYNQELNGLAIEFYQCDSEDDLCQTLLDFDSEKVDFGANMDLVNKYNITSMEFFNQVEKALKQMIIERKITFSFKTYKNNVDVFVYLSDYGNILNLNLNNENFDAESYSKENNYGDLEIEIKFYIKNAIQNLGNYYYNDENFNDVCESIASHMINSYN